MKTLINLIALVFLFSYSKAQVLEPTDYEQKLSYTELETDYYLVNEKDVERLSLLDKVKMKELKTEREYTKYINSNNERTTIIKHVSSDNIYEDWMEKPEILLIDKNGVEQLTFSGERVNYIEHSPHYLEISKQSGPDLLPTFVLPSREQKIKLQSAGFEVNELNNGFVQIRSKNQELIYNEALLYFEENQLDENGEVIRSRKVNFMQLPDGEIVQQKIREGRVYELDNNIKAEHVFLRLFTNYEYENIYEKERADENTTKADVNVNSDQNLLQIRYSPFTDSKQMNYTLYSMSGRLILSASGQNNGSENIDISELTPGIYILSMESDGKMITKKFVKL